MVLIHFYFNFLSNNKITLQHLCLNHLTYFHETLCEQYAIVEYPNIVLFKFLLSVITKWQTHKLVRWKLQWNQLPVGSYMLVAIEKIFTFFKVIFFGR